MDRFLDELAQKIAEAAKQQGMPEVYDAHEKRSYDNYYATAFEAGLQPEPYDALKQHYEPFNAYRKALTTVRSERE